MSLPDHLIEMQKRFLKSMKYIYPTGVQNKHHWRDVIKIYFMGWLDALKETYMIDEVLIGEYSRTIELMKPMTDLNWWPDETWRWWP